MINFAEVLKRHKSIARSTAYMVLRHESKALEHVSARIARDAGLHDGHGYHQMLLTYGAKSQG